MLKRIGHLSNISSFANWFFFLNFKKEKRSFKFFNPNAQIFAEHNIKNMLDSVACRWKALNLFMKFTFPSLSYLLLVLWSKKYFIPAWLLSAQDCHLFNYRLLSGANQHPHAKTQDCRPQTRVRRKEYQQVESQVRCPLTPFWSQVRNPI